MFYLFYKHQWNTKPFHFNSFGVKSAIYYVAIAKVIFSHVKISRFRAKAHLVFHWCLYNTWTILLVFSQSSYKELISRVLEAFKPGRFLMTLFANEVSINHFEVLRLSQFHVCPSIPSPPGHLLGIWYFDIRKRPGSIQLFRENVLEKMCTRQSRKVIWDMINSLLLTR